MAEALTDPLRHHGDVEADDGRLDFAVNVFPGPPPDWLLTALRASLDEVGGYPSAAAAEAAVARRHERRPVEVLATAGAAEAFTLVARLSHWRRPVVVHPQFTEPHQALLQAGCPVDPLVLVPPFALDPDAVPADADLVVVGNPTNPTGRLHAAEHLLRLVRPGRVVLVDEAFLDAVPGEAETLIGVRRPGLLLLRSLTKLWGIPGVRAGYVVGDADLVAGLRQRQTPWSVSAAAAAALVATAAEPAPAEAARRVASLAGWRSHLTDGLAASGVSYLPSAAPFVLARPGAGIRERLRDHGIAVRRGDTFPGLGADWVRIAVRPPAVTDRLLTALAATRG